MRVFHSANQKNGVGSKKPAPPCWDLPPTGTRFLHGDNWQCLKTFLFFTKWDPGHSNTSYNKND